jgi:diaminohydroxyphosphoribosylaminopyrimidine deaminase/5-amino-6-(5-phosphoribosylamino)uracil reductase
MGFMDEPALPEFDPRRIAAKLAAGNRPYVTLKAAASLDGKIATRDGESQWITGEIARTLGHALRARHDAVLVGLNTVLRDDPSLTVRPPGGTARLARIVLDSRCRTPAGARLLAADGAARFVIAGSRAPMERVDALRAEGVRVFLAPTARPEPAAFLPWLRAQGLRSILVEGGAAVHGALIANGEADELFLFLAGRLIGDPAAPAWCGPLGISGLAGTPRLRLSPPRPVGEDILVHGLFLRPEAGA